MLVPHSQVSCTRNFYKSTCTRNLTVCHAFLHKFFLTGLSPIPQRDDKPVRIPASNRTELHSTQETCRHVTKIEKCDWSACLLTIDDLLFALFAVAFLLFVSFLHKNLHLQYWGNLPKFLVQETWASFLWKILDCVDQHYE